ncbi:hypothetical protein [Nicoliella lavandulae]|uniref:Uncharacterized protein n=1 Tax=Nicoliella lavandulae TaxID=3082954 RepID=A0ABU8SN59_9LACO
MSIVDGNPNVDTTVFYNASNENNLLYPDKFHQWQTRNNFKSYRQIGRFSDNEIAEHLPVDKDKTVVLIGGPDKMGSHWIKALKQMGIERSQIYYEKFSW